MREAFSYFDCIFLREVFFKVRPVKIYARMFFCWVQVGRVRKCRMQHVDADPSLTDPLCSYAAPVP